MMNYRLWGKPPFQIAVVHGGPGAPGSIAGVARELTKDRGILEPLQSAKSVDRQIAELRATLVRQATLPAIIIGWSWGATLSYLTAARHPELVKKLIIVSTGPINSQGQPRPDLTPVYMERLNEAERKVFFELVHEINDGKPEGRNAAFGRLCRVISRAEIYAPVPAEDDVLEYQYDVNMAIGRELQDMLPGGTLAACIKQIQCPVTAIQGSYDPRPAAEVEEAFGGAVKDFKLIVLEKCGHTPWLEQHARDEFFRILREEIGK